MRGEGRGARAARGSIAGVVSRIVSAAASIAAVPLLLGYLGLDGYGLWVTSVALTVWVGLGNLGLPFSLLNQLAALPREDAVSRRQLVATAWWLCVGLALLLLLPLPVLTSQGAWAEIFNVSEASLVESATVFVVVMWLGAVITIPLTIAQAAIRANQRVAVASTFEGLAALARLAAIGLVVITDGGITQLVLAAVAAPLCVIGGASVFAFVRHVEWPRFSDCDRTTAHHLLGTGLGFLGITFGALCVTSIDVILVAQLLGPASVPIYSVAFSLLLLQLGLELAVLDGFWPAYVEAASKMDGTWIERTNRTVASGLIAASAVFAACLILFGATAIDVWAGPEAVPPQSLLVVFGATALVQAVEVAHNRVLIAIGEVKQVTKLGLAAAAVNVPVSIVLGLQLGVTGIAAGTFVAYAVFGVVTVRLARQAMRRLGASRLQPGVAS